MAPFAPELEAAAADSVAGEIGRARRHALPPGTPCANCGAPLEGPWCHRCGQRGEDYHRSIWHLVAEAFEGLTHLDGRVWKTLPRLIYRPGKLTRDYLDGHRASQIPPFRVYLVALLVVFFTGGMSAETGRTNLKVSSMADPKVQAEMTPEARAGIEDAMAKFKSAKVADSQDAWWRDRAVHAVENPEALFTAMEHWGHRLAFLLLPIAALLLAPLFMFRKGVYFFDHLIFAMHSLSFQGLLLSAIFLANLVVGGAFWLLLLAPAHLFVHLRGTYGIGAVGTLGRMLALFIGSAIAVGFLLVGLVLIGVATAH